MVHYNKLKDNFNLWSIIPGRVAYSRWFFIIQVGLQWKAKQRVANTQINFLFKIHCSHFLLFKLEVIFYTNQLLDHLRVKLVFTNLFFCRTIVFSVNKKVIDILKQQVKIIVIANISKKVFFSKLICTIQFLWM